MAAGQNQYARRDRDQFVRGRRRRITTEAALNASSARASQRIAIYPGTFDPVHNGHLDIAIRAAALFDLVVVAVYNRPAKSLLFPPEQRLELFRQSLAHAEAPENLVVEGYSNLTVQFAKRRGAVAIVRGLRAVTDFEYEYQMTTMNRHLEREVETVLMMTSLQFAYLSSTIVKEVAMGGAGVSDLVPPAVAKALAKQFHPRSS